MAKVKLSAQGLPKLKAGTYWDSLVLGLHVRVSARGRRTFLLRYRFGGKQRREKLGVYDADHYTLKQARAAARAMATCVTAGRDPRVATAALFEAEATRVIEDHAKERGLRAKTVSERERLLKTQLIPRWGARRITDISRSDVKALRADMADTPVQANRTISLVSVIFNELLDDELVPANPAHRIRPLPEPKRKRFLDRREMGVVWAALDKHGLIMGNAIRVALLTAQRIGAVRQMRWDQIHGSTWRVPAAAFKGNREHWVPLSIATRGVLDESRTSSPWVFPTLRSDGGVPHLAKTDHAVRAVVRATGLPSFRAHDFRTTFRTHVTRPTRSSDPDIPDGCGVDPAIADAVLGHKEDTVSLKHYHGRPEEHRLADKRDALEKWGAFVSQSVGLDHGIESD